MSWLIAINIPMKKKETKDNYLYNRYNLMFGIYNTDDNAVYPSLSDNGLALNWLNLKSSIITVWAALTCI